MPSELPPQLRELASFQHGILTSDQVVEGGQSRNIIRSRLRQGSWQRLHSGVYAVFSGDPGRLAVLWAAVLRTGPGATLSHLTAAELDRLTDQQSALIHVMVPVERRISQIPSVVLHRSERVNQARHPVLAPPRTRIEETVLDLACSAPTLDDACGWLTRALGRRLTTQDRLRDAMELRSRIRWRRDLAEVLAADGVGVHSSLEYRYLRNVERAHGLPRGSRQARVRRGSRSQYRDVLYDDYDLAVELDGRAAHPGDSRWADIHRDNAAAADGVVTLRYGWLDVSQHPCAVAAQVAQVLQRRGFIDYRACSPTCAVSALVRP
jgi:very-short-patch-repair endonuclease